jgi:mono/diheme cytochrome c family protein
MEELMKRILSLVVVAAMALMFAGVERQLTAAKTATAPRQTFAARVDRGRALVNFGGCHDCHTPLKMGANGPEPDMSRALSGHPAQLVMPPAPKLGGPWVWAAAGTNTAFAGPWGVSYTRNLTPDQVTGLGIWTEEMFIKTMRTGRHMGVSRPILPPMPWQNLNSLPDEDLKSIYAYLRTIKPIHNEVPDAIIAPPPPAPVASKK